MAPTAEGHKNGTSNGTSNAPAALQQQQAASSPAEAAAGDNDDDMADSINDDAGADASESEGGGNDNDVKSKKRKERLEQNRISARESRKRKKTMIEELQRTVITLSKENKELTDRNDQLRTQLMEIASKYPNVVPLQALMNGAPAAQLGMNPGAQQLQQQQQRQAAAVAAAAQATYNPLAFWPQHQQHMAQAPAPTAGNPSDATVDV